MSDKNTGGAFDALLAEIGGLAGETEALAKAMPADVGAEDDENEDEDEGMAPAPAGEDTAEDDEKIKAAAAEGDDGGKPFGKSFTLKLDDGTEVEAVDGADLVKSLIARVEANEGSVKGALEQTLGIIKAQGEMLKSLAGEVAAFKASGKGRKAVLSIAEKPAAAVDPLLKSTADEGITGEAFMAKALAAQAAGQITGREVATAESFINMGQTPPVEIVRAVMAATQ